MSALLAALKKAAEEKNKRQQRTPAPLTSPQLDSQPIEEALQIDFAEGIEASAPNPSQASDKLGDPSESVQLNFVDDTLNDELFTSSNNPQEESSSSEESELSSESEAETDSELAIEDIGGEVDSEFLTEASEPLSEDIPLALDREQVSISEEAKNTENADAEQVTTPMSTGDSIDSTSFKMVEEVTDNGSDKRQRLDLETSLALNDETDSVSSSIKDAQASSQRKQSDEDRQEGTADTALAQEDDWSLENIPGYQHNENQSSQRNMQRFIQAIQPKGGIKSHLSIKHWMWVPLILISLGYFGLVMYERESARMVADLKPFQMQATLPAISQPESKQKSLVIAKEQVGQSELEKQESILGKTPASELDASAVSPKQPEQQPKQPEQKAPLAALVNEKKPTQPAKPTQVKTSGEKPKSTMNPATKPNYRIEMVKPNKAVFDGYEAYQQGDFAAAERFYQQAYASDPENLPALFGLAATAAKKGESQKSLQLYQQILAKMPDNQEAIVAAAMIETALTEGPELREKLEQLVRQMPKNAQLHMALGHQYAQKKDWVFAQKYYFKAYELDSTNPAHARNLAISLDQLGQYALAKQYYEQTLALSDLNADQQQLKKRLMVINRHLLEESTP